MTFIHTYTEKHCMHVLSYAQYSNALKCVLLHDKCGRFVPSSSNCSCSMYLILLKWSCHMLCNLVSIFESAVAEEAT